MKIHTYSWNTESILFADHLNSDNYDGWIQYLCNFSSYTCPDILVPILDRTEKEKPDIIVISFQEDAFPGSYVHSHVLPKEMSSRGYKLLKRGRMTGIGVTTTKTYRSRGLRTSIYTTYPLFDSIIEYETQLYNNDTKYQSYLANLYSEDGENQRYEMEAYTDSYWRNKGAIAIYISIKEYTIVFINMHLPFESKRLDPSISHDPIHRQDYLSVQNNMYNEIYRKFILQPSNRPIPDYAIIMGDLNYRVSTNIDVRYYIDTISSNLAMYYEQMDEMNQQMNKGNIYRMEEGVNGKGPEFLPTCKMAKPRDNTEKSTYYKGYSIGSKGQRIPSWCDRILYKSYSESKIPLICTSYQSLYKKGSMDKSDHNMVYALFEL